MWIEPNGQVKIIRNVDLDNNYDNTIYFASRTAQYNYFNSKVKYTYNKITYQRVKRNYMRVEINAENLYDCNYLMFQNTSFGNRWFYAFITKVEYLSNMVSEIEYEIDVMQTWFMDCTMGMSYIEREHSVTDNFGVNRVEENLEFGEYMIGDMTQSKDGNGNLIFEDYYLIIASTQQRDSSGSFHSASMSIYNGLPSGLNLAGFDISTPAGLEIVQMYIDDMTDADRESIVDAFLVPKKFVTGFRSGNYGDILNSTDLVTFNYNVSMPQSVGSYTPRNKKVLQYPYNLLFVTDLHGNEAEYRYEDFDTPISNGCTFEYNLALSCDPSIQIVPKNYKTESKCYNEQMVYKGYPHVSWNVDMWKMYTAQNGGVMPTMRKEISNAILPVAGAVAMGIATGGTSIPLTMGAAAKSFATKAVIGIGASKVASSLQQVRHHYVQPPSASGNFNGDIIFMNKSHDFWYARVHIRSDFAERIDKYFDKYGYATKTIKIPNINSRPHWNFVQTIGANIFGNIPADDLKLIKEIFDAGITFWKNGDNIGNYSLDNRPV